MSPELIFDDFSFHPSPSTRNGSPCPPALCSSPPCMLYHSSPLCLGSLPLLASQASPCPPLLTRGPYALPCPTACPIPSPRGRLLLLLARCSVVWREAINSSVSSALIDTVWTEDGKINKGNSVQAGLQAAATFLMLNNNRFSTKVCG